MQDARAYVQTQDANGDETTGWEQGRRGWLWGAVPQGGRVFCMRAARGAKGLREVRGEA